MRLTQAAEQMETLGNLTRLKVYRALVRAGDEGLPVGRLQKKTRKSRVSKPTQSAKQIAGAQYDPANEHLHVVFRDGTTEEVRLRR